MKNGLFIGLLLSAIIHGVTVTGLYAWPAARKPQAIVAELDFSISMAPMATRTPNAGGRKTAPTPAAPSTTEIEEPITEPATTEAEAPIAVDEPANLPCPDPCANTETMAESRETGEDPVADTSNESGPAPNPGADLQGSGMGEREGVYVPLSQVSQKPRLAGNFISSRDYPVVAKEAGKDGRVVLLVLIDEKGRVRDARLLQGAYEALNEVALRKVREAVFTPAYNANGQAIPSKVTLPIRFELTR